MIMRKEDTNTDSLIGGPAVTPTPPDPQAQLRRLQVEAQALISYLDRVESLWVNLQKRSNAELLPVDLLSYFLAEVESLLPTVLSAIYRVDRRTYEFTLERCIPSGLRADVENETQLQIAQGYFALALRRSRPTVSASQRVHHYHPRVRSIILIPLTTLQEVHGMALIASERLEQDITPYELKLLSILAGQTALALESSQREVALQQQRTDLDQEVRRRTAELTQANTALQQTIQDLQTELKTAHDEIEQLSLAERMRESLLASASHDLRTPLSAIIGSLDVIREEWTDRLPEEGRQLLEMCARNSATLLSMLTDLFDVSAIQGERVVLRRQQVVLAPLVQKTFDTVGSMARSHNVKLLNTVPQEIEVYADPTRLQQVLISLTSNAIKSAKKVGAYVLVGAAREGNQVTIGVTDNGAGIPREQQEHIFKLFTSTESGSLTATKGANLGLALCKTLIELHGGRIWLESTPGKGSRFFLSLSATASTTPSAR
ncbi:MAG: ATP-binding protein [Candidatus Binatia bacterium]